MDWDRALNICLIGSFEGHSDEGMKIVARRLAQKLEETQNILKLDIYKIIRLNGFRELKNFNPDVVHYVSGPSPASFVILQSVKASCRIQLGHEVKTVMTATQPYLPFNSISFLKKLKPDLLIVQSDQNEKFFKNMGFRTEYLPNGVDTERFKPVNESQKQKLRKKYGLADKKLIALHVGSVRENRGLDIMRSVAQMKDTTALVIGSTTSPLEQEMLSGLLDSGCLVWRQYIESIQEIYQLADLYIFPVEETLGSIDVPLSVMEAMACNLPVITTRFGGFPRLFTGGGGFYYVNSRLEIPRKMLQVMTHNALANVETRRKVNPYSWGNVSNTLSEYYANLLVPKN